jgi:hypothetical protein
MKRWKNKLNRKFSKEEIQLTKITGINAQHPCPERKCK